jgi:hypothetical protein
MWWLYTCLIILTGFVVVCLFIHYSYATIDNSPFYRPLRSTLNAGTSGDWSTFYCGLMPAATLAILGWPVRQLTKKTFHQEKAGVTSCSLYSKTVTLGTYNTALNHAFLNIYNGLRPAEERVVQIVELLTRQSPDIICLQECFHEDANRVLFQVYPYSLHHAGHNNEVLKNPVFLGIRNVGTDYFGFTSGLAVMSRLPIESWTFRHFDPYDRVLEEIVVPRGVLRTVLGCGSNDKPPKQIIVYI